MFRDWKAVAKVRPRPEASGPALEMIECEGLIKNVAFT